ncbi:host attachment family protein [Sphingomonas sp. LB-2]|uniref:host attachment family protein n=1 Tax=Sphingomonas caeni TaxID=2984949 RepID=UPI00223159C9|nr:host attachment family protein [Sphingomonas caeni]MCW3846026.1 host attachment family protein [Sphingomonas caeni]
MLVPHGALVLVLDGAHVQLLRNRGGDVVPDLEAVPGDQIPRCAGRTDDRHQDRFARDVIAAVDPLLAGGTPLILVAPPQRLGELRAEVPKRVRRHIVGEIAKDLAGCAPQELAHRLHLVAA